MRNGPILIGFAAATALALAPVAPARGETPLPASIPDLVGARALAIGAYRGLAGGNDGIFANAASLAATKRYAIETQWLIDRVGADTAFQAFGASVVDSEMGSVTGGFAFTHVPSGPWTGNLFHLAMAFPLSTGLYLGATGKYQSLDGPGGDEMRAANFDASAFWQPVRLVGVGVTGYNLLSAGHKTLQPRALGVGGSVGDDRRFHVAADWRGDFDRQGKLTSAYALGGEVLLADLVPVRAGYLRDETRNASFWSAGLGVVSSSGIAIDVTYRQGIDDSQNRMFAVALKLFLFAD